MKFNIYNWSNKKRLRLCILSIFTLGILIDIGLKHFFPNLLIGVSDPLSLNFAPELWIGLIAIVLGTLIIVISIASQSTPKLLSFFIGDFTSLLYNSCLIFGLLHSFYSSAQSQDAVLTQLDSLHINALIFLPLAGLATLPYTLYILSYTKKSRIISIITYINKHSIRQLPVKDKKLNNAKVARIHKNLLSGLNSLDDLFEYLSFKEPKGQILNSVALLLREFILNKKHISEEIFTPTRALRKDISFQNMNDEINYIKDTKTFYEFKCLHIISDAYFKLINNDEYQLASLCGNELTECGITALRAREESSIEAIFITYNTMLRLSLKHGMRTGEVRNTYNLLFHYSRLYKALIDHNKIDLLLKQSRHLCYYAGEIYKVTPGVPSFIFLTDVLYLEFNNILSRASVSELDHAAQERLLYQYCSISPSDTLISKHPELAKQIMASNRLMKIKLILFYMHKGQVDFRDVVLDDLFQDLRKENQQNPLQAIFYACKILDETEQLFWETTDRGNKNIYYNPYKEEMQDFIQLISDRLVDAYPS